MPKCNDWDNPLYYNIQVFRQLEVATTASKVTGVAL
jgi:hypothetical protein